MPVNAIFACRCSKIKQLIGTQLQCVNPARFSAVIDIIDECVRSGGILMAHKYLSEEVISKLESFQYTSVQHYKTLLQREELDPQSDWFTERWYAWSLYFMFLA